MAEIKNLKKAAKRITEAVKNKERIILYGDADLDGVTSVIILEEAIRTLGGKISTVYFPDRETEGYGISEIGLDFLKDKAPALLVAVDCGIGNFKEIKLAKKAELEVIVIDHHEVLDELPEADIIVDPKQKGDKYPFKKLAAAGLAFKLAEALLKKKMTGTLRRNFLELVALATLADMMPKESENKMFIEEGLSSLEKSFRPGITVFLEEETIKNFPSLNQRVSRIISILNIRDIEDRLPASFRLLTSPTPEIAGEIVKKLLEKSKLRKEKIEIIVQEVESKILNKSEPIVFEGNGSFELTLMSSAASIICKEYQKPTFLYKKMERESQGTVRTPAGIDSVALMKKCSKYLLTFGGHPQASGFRIKNENLEKFKECLIKNLNNI
jgi:single-stranded-DNA-specific exonuclease